MNVVFLHIALLHVLSQIYRVLTTCNTKQLPDLVLIAIQSL